MAKESKAQYTLVDKSGEIQAIILTRGSEFYCFERLEDSPTDLKAAQELYPDCQLIGLQMSAEPKVLVTCKPEVKKTLPNRTPEGVRV